MKWQITCLSLLLVIIAVGCRTQPPLPSQEQRDAIYARSEMQFENAILLKPRALTNADQAFALAPLLIRETGGSAPSPKVVYYASGEVRIAGRILRQMTYVWDSASMRACCGVRLTLNDDGRPFIWEILEPGAAFRQIIVAQSLETAASRAFGNVLPGRHFAVEADVTNAPTAVVARVIDDGPAVMGPMVQVDAQGRVMTAFCRCMPTPSRAVSGEGYFELQPLTGRLFMQSLDTVLRAPAVFFQSASTKGG